MGVCFLSHKYGGSYSYNKNEISHVKEDLFQIEGWCSLIHSHQWTSHIATVAKIHSMQVVPSKKRSRQLWKSSQNSLLCFIDGVRVFYSCWIQIQVIMVLWTNVAWFRPGDLHLHLCILFHRDCVASREPYLFISH